MIIKMGEKTTQKDEKHVAEVQLLAKQ